MLSRFPSLLCAVVALVFGLWLTPVSSATASGYETQSESMHDISYERSVINKDAYHEYDSTIIPINESKVLLILYKVHQKKDSETGGYSPSLYYNVMLM